jgi:hypothetical protein
LWPKEETGVGDGITRNGMIYYHFDDEINKYEIDRACSKFERDDRCVEVFCGKRRKRPLGKHE